MHKFRGRDEHSVFELLAEAHPTLLSSAEISKEIGHPVDDTLGQLERNGLVHRLTADGGESHFWLTRAAVYATVGRP